MSPAADVLVRVRSSPDGSGYLVEAELGDGTSINDGRLLLDRSALLASETAADAATYGRLLFDALFSGPLRTAFEAAMPDPQAGDLLRVRLSIETDAAELDGLRWERLYRERRGSWLPLAAAGDSPFSRFRSSPYSEPLPVATLPIRILLAVANPESLPRGLAAIDVEAEIGVLRDALAEAAATDDVEVTVLHGRTVLSPGLRDGLERDGFVIADGPTTLAALVRLASGSHIVHFVGHGGFGQGVGGTGPPQSSLFLESDAGSWAPATADQLIEGLKTTDAPPVLVYLSACESGRTTDDKVHPFVALAPRLVDSGSGAAVAMQAAVPVAAARTLTRTFYARLLNHGLVDLALNEARAVLAAAGGLDWTIPVLVSRLRGGRLLVRHDLAGRVVSGDISLTPGADHGAVADRAADAGAPRPRPTPVLLLPRDFSGLLGREAEVVEAQRHIATGGSIEFHGSAGVGKSVLLRFLSNHLGAPASEGVLFVPRAGEPPHDVLQYLFDALYEADASTRPTDAELERLLAEREPVVVFDDADVPPDDLGRLLELVPRGRFLLGAAEQNLWGEHVVVALAGLAPDKARALFERGLGRPITTEERPRAEAICAALQGHPLHILQAAAKAASGEWPATPAASKPALTGFSETERRTLAVIAAAAAPIRIERIQALVGEAAIAAAARLEDAGVLRSATGRYALAEPLDSDQAGALDLPGWRARLLDELVRWAEQNRNSPAALLRDLDAPLGLLDHRDAADRPDLVLRLARGLEGALLLAKRFERWREVLDIEAETLAGGPDQASLGWVRHQQGSRLLAIGDRTGARVALTEALDIRTSLGDVAGAAVSRHNLELAAPIPPPPGQEGSGTSTLRRLVGRLRGPLGLALAALVVTSGAVVAWALINQPPRVPAALPSLTLDPSSVDLGTVEIGSHSERIVTLVNASDVALRYAISLDPPVSDISLADACNGLAAPRSSCQVTISFVPSADGNRGSTLVIDDNTIDAHHSVAVAAQGAVPPGKPGITIDPAAIDFGAVRLDTSASATITILSSGDADLEISSVQFAAGDPFVIETTDCIGTLAVGSSCIVAIQFRPGDRIAYSDTLNIGDAADPAGHAVAVVGSGLVGLADLRVGLDVIGPWVWRDDGTAALPVVVVVRNEGDVEAAAFYLNAQAHVPEQEASAFELALIAGPSDYVAQGDDWRPITQRPLAPGEQITFEAEIIFGPYFGGQHAAVAVLADSCVGEEIFDPAAIASCRVAEIDEANNLSNELDVDIPLPIETLQEEPPLIDTYDGWYLVLPSAAPV
jgi:hypothetical protein